MMGIEIFLLCICTALFFLGGLFLYLIYLYNSLASFRVRVEETLKQIDVRLQNRYDLLPDLINAVEKATSTDENIQTKIAEVRSGLSQLKDQKLTPENAASVSQIENRLLSSLGAINIAVESYPDLKSQIAIQNFMKQNQEIEEMIAAARQIYNSTVREYNEKIVTFPSNLIASAFGFKKAEFFEAASEAKKDIMPDWGAKIQSR
jgi:LemA protein